MDGEFVAMLRPFLTFVGDEPITEQSRLRDLGLNSMREIELLFALEDRYGVTVPDDKLVDATFETSGALWSVIEQLCAAAGGERP